MRTSATLRRLRLKRILGRDRNPLRRRADVIDAWLAPATLVIFLALCPLVVAVTGTLVRAHSTAIVQAQSSWRPVRAVLTEAAPGAMQSAFDASAWVARTRARWTADGRTVTGVVPAPAGAKAGATVTVWLDSAGKVELPPLTRAAASERVPEVTLSALAVLAALLSMLMLLVRYILDRRRLGSWETAWLSVGPTWSRRG
jgi:hypothetical protein